MRTARKAAARTAADGNAAEDQRRPGRPRSEEADRAIIAATRELFAESGADVGLLQIGESIWSISFGSVRIGYLDELNSAALNRRPKTDDHQ